MRRFRPLIFFLLALPVFASIVDLTPGKNLLKDGEYVKARDFFRHALIMDPGDPEIYLYLGYSFLGMGEQDSAEYYATRGLSISPDNLSFKLLKLSSLMRNGEWGKALRWAERIKEEHPDDSLSNVALFETYFNYGAALYSRGQKDSALIYFKKALKISPRSPAVYTNIAIIFYEKGELDSSLFYVKRGLERFPANPQLLKAEAQIFAKENRVKELKNVFGTLVTVEPRNLDLWLKFALIYRSTGKVDSAIYIYKKLIREYPDSFRVYEQYAGLYEGIFDYPKVRQIYAIYARRHPNDVRAILKIAETFENERKYDSALVYYKRAVKLSSDDKELKVKIPEMLVKLVKKDEATASYRNLIKEYPVDINLWKALGLLLEERDSALVFYRQMASRFPISPYPYARIGIIFYRDSLLDSARVYLKRAVELKSEQAEVYYDLAKIYFGDGDKRRGKLVVRIAFRTLTGKIANLGRVIQSNENLLELQKHADEIKMFENTNDYLQKLLALLQENVSDSEYFQFLNSLERRYPRSFLVLKSLTKYYLEHGETRKALTYATKLVEVNPSIGENHYLRGKVLINTGNLSGAYIEFEKALDSGVETPEFARDFIALGEKVGRLDETVEQLRKIDNPEVKKILKEYDSPRENHKRRG